MAPLFGVVDRSALQLKRLRLKLVSPATGLPAFLKDTVRKGCTPVRALLTIPAAGQSVNSIP
jgi:hypothetical protein